MNLFSEIEAKEINSQQKVKNSILESYWLGFKPTVEKLEKERKAGQISGSIDSDWWKSRYSDWLTKTNSQPKSVEEWEWRTAGYNLWDDIWLAHRKEMDYLWIEFQILLPQ
jgi:hypothetical protein